jgi:hypothetical protein
LFKTAKHAIFAAAIFAGMAALTVVAVPTAAPAQSAYTSGTAASRERAGYPSPYGGGGFYAYAPGYTYGYTIPHRSRRSRVAH